jgi:uncharacterized repeat protein (TIGR03803 family)
MNSRGFRAWTTLALSLALSILDVTSIAIAQQSFHTLVNFGGIDGANPPAPLVQGSDGNLYGTTYAGGANSGGTVFRMTTAGALTTLYSFCAQAGCVDGQGPNGSLTLATNGNFYGTTLVGGEADSGTAFEITPAGSLTPLYSFCTQSNCSDGKRPFAGLIEASDGNLYGTTVFGGTYNDGTVFRITPAGLLTTLHSFQGSDGAEPYAGVIQATDGNLYGATYNGGAGQAGTVFRITLAGAFTTLYSFCAESDCADGAQPYSALLETTNRRLYGTTEHNGAHNSGTIFTLTPAGALTTVYAFCGQPACADGGYPHAPLIEATDGSLYGTTDRGGASGYGTIFRLTGSMLTTLGSFQGTNGTEPDGLVQAANGLLYGATLEGGTNSLCPYDDGCGVIFTLSLVPSP